MQAVLFAVALGIGAAVDGQGEGDLDAAGNVQLFIAAFNQLAGGVGAVALSHVPVAAGIFDHLALHQQIHPRRCLDP